MKHQALIGVVSLLLAAGIGCSNNSSPSSATGGTGNAGSSSVAGGGNGGTSNSISTVVEKCPTFTTDTNSNIKLPTSAANNYSFTSSIAIQTTKVASKKDLTFDWSAMTKDMYGEPIDPKSGIGNAVLAQLTLSLEDLQTKVNNDEIVAQDHPLAATYLTQGTADHCATTDLSEAGQPIDHDYLMSKLDASVYGPAGYTYMLIISAGTDYGKNARMMTTFTLDAAESNTALTLTNASTTVQFEAKLDSLTPTIIPMGAANIDLDWTNMTTNAMKRTVDWFKITKVLVARFTQTPADLQKNENFLKLDTLANAMWTNEDLTATHTLLSTLKDKDGIAFTGIDNTHTWIVALECGSCMNPAPWYISVLKPCNK